MKTSLQKILRGGLHLSFARIAVLGLSVLQSIILAKLLGPHGFGEVALFNLILTYVNLTGLGFDSVAAREIPGYAINGRQEAIEQVVNHSLSIELTLRLIISLLVMLVGLVCYRGTLRIGIVLIAPVLVVQRLSMIYFSFQNSLKSFATMGRATMISGALLAFLTIALVKFTGVYTKLLATLVTEAIVAYYLTRNMTFKFKLTLRGGRFTEMLKMGLPFVALSLVYFLWRASDRTLVAKFMDLRTLGIYSFAVYCVQLLMTFLRDFNGVLQPFIYERISQESNPGDILPLIKKPTVFYAYLTPILICFLWVLYPPVLKLIMPKYMDSVPIFRICLFQIYIVNISTAINYLMRSSEINKQSWLVMSYGGAAIVSYASILLFWRMGFGTAAAVYGILLSNIVPVVANFGLAQRYYLEKSQARLKYYASILLPIVYAAAYLFLIGLIPDGSFLKLLPCQLVMVTIFSLPLLFFANKKLNLLAEVQLFLAGRKAQAMSQ
jgi:O-antigen/teichoic acid export membrane protein